jgi:hypothetical protein
MNQTREGIVVEATFTGTHVAGHKSVPRFDKGILEGRNVVGKLE